MRPQLTLCEFGHQLSITRAQRGAKLVALSHAAVSGRDDLAELNEGVIFVWVLFPSKRVETVLFHMCSGQYGFPRSGRAKRSLTLRRLATPSG